RPYRADAERLSDQGLLGKLRTFDIDLDRPTLEASCRDATATRSRNGWNRPAERPRRSACPRPVDDSVPTMECCDDPRVSVEPNPHGVHPLALAAWSVLLVAGIVLSRSFAMDYPDPVLEAAWLVALAALLTAAMSAWR